MAILIGEKTQYLIQGITGKQGSITCKRMLESGSKVVAGVTPGKGGEVVEGVPVYNSIKEAKEKHEIDASVIYVPPGFAKGAIVEAIENGIPLINIITENIPVHDIAYCLALAKDKKVRIVGPSSIGIYSVGKSKSGSIASGGSQRAFAPGTIGVISKSGGMSSESSLVLKQAGFGQSTVVGIGGDVLMGESFVGLAKDFELDEDTEGIVIFGEIGGTAEEDLAEYLIGRRKEGYRYKKPIVAFISGEFASKFKEVSLGHAGAIIEGEKGTRDNKVKVLKEAGVIVADVHHEIGMLMKGALGKNEN